MLQYSTVCSVLLAAYEVAGNRLKGNASLGGPTRGCVTLFSPESAWHATATTYTCTRTCSDAVLQEDAQAGQLPTLSLSAVVQVLSLPPSRAVIPQSTGFQHTRKSAQQTHSMSSRAMASLLCRVKATQFATAQLYGRLRASKQQWTIQRVQV